MKFFGLLGLRFRTNTCCGAKKQ